MRRAILVMLALLMVSCARPGKEIAPEHGDLLISNVRTVGFEGEVPEIRARAFVLVRDGQVVAVRNDAAGLSADEAVDGTGLTMIPGLTDMHVHVWDEAELGAYLSWGVTTVRNMSGLPFHLTLQERIEAGELAGPHLITTGPILNSLGPNAQVNHQIVETAEEARAAVAWQAEQGFRRLKVYSNLTREAYDAIIEEAAARDLIVTGHSPEGVRLPGIPLEKPFGIGFEEVLAARFETIEHIETVVWHGLRDRHDEEAAHALARKITAAGVPITTTLLAHHNLWLVAETQGEALTRPGTEMLNPLSQKAEAGYQQYWAKRAPGPVAEDGAFYARVTDIFQDEGVLLVAGTDAGIFTNIPGQSLVTEMELLVQAGLTPYEALQTATYNPAIVFGTVGQAGCVSAGCRADLVLYACDPLADISCLNSPEAMVRAGKWLPQAELLALRETSRHPDIQRTQENVLSGLAEQGVDIGALQAVLE